FLGSVTTDFRTNNVVGQLCVAVSSGSAFPTTSAGWKSWLVDVVDAPYCLTNGSGDCYRHAYLEYPSLGGDTSWLVVSGVRANMSTPTDCLPGSGPCLSQ